MRIKKKKLAVRKDMRGSFFEVLRPEDVGNPTFGQVYITTAKIGETKGKHYHTRKTEWFCVVKGEGLLSLVDKKTNIKTKIKMGEKNMIFVKIPPNWYHAIKNIGKEEMFLLAYIDESFNPDDPDTFFD